MKKQGKRIPIQVRVPIISDKQNCCPYEEPFGYIYKITNRVNGHYYVGKHEFHYPWLDKSYKGSGTVLIDAYNSSKYSEEDFDMSILEWTDQGNNKLNELEVYWIRVFNAYIFPFHYNLTEGGDGGITWGNPENNPSKSLEVRKKISENKKSLGENHPMKSEKARRNQSEK